MPKVGSWTSKADTSADEPASPKVKRGDSKTKDSRGTLACKQLASKWFLWLCRQLCESRVFTFITTLLTIYALFGDDLRLLCTDKPADPYFDVVTVTCMAVFCVEIVVFSIGKPGYFLGFFFTLDFLSTLTLALDLTPVAENLFGDSISQQEGEEAGSSGGAAGGSSADAARAARASRAGTKAGRVVRLIRLIRLIRFMKIFKSAKKDSSYEMHPGDEEDHDDWDSKVQESSVSKKLSEMTTRRVVMLVLIIMIALKFLQADMYAENLSNSAQYGMNMLFRRWRDDLDRFQPSLDTAHELAYLDSPNRRLYEEDLTFYVYQHNWFCSAEEIPADNDASPRSNFGKLFWLGVGSLDSPDADYFLPRLDPDTDWDATWKGQHWEFYQCGLPLQARETLTQPWANVDGACQNFRGVSLISHEEARVECPSDLRYAERRVVYPQLITADEWDTAFVFVFDRRAGSQMESVLNICQTLFICVLLGVGAMTFSNDANKLVLMPIERMILKLEKIRNNPLEAMTIGEDEHHREEKEKAKNKRVKVDVALLNGQIDLAALNSPKARVKRFIMTARRALEEFTKQFRSQKREEPEPMETVVLEKTIIKIGSLLALGFGEAGAEIIGQNMRGSDTSALNAMIPGRKVDAIFGFCDIRNFTDATEVLQDQVMVFVNRIAGVVHSCINEFFGSPNKNIGDAFLLVWRLSGHPERKQKRLADMSLVCFLNIIAQINKSPLLAEYRAHPKLVKRMPNYRVRMGFGLHSGWAIEGAIGSEFKIDASYLSPNVNMVQRLESMTKQFGSLVLLSEAIIQLMTEEVGAECRLIDYVAIAAGPPFKLYTIDLDDLALELDRSMGVTLTKAQKHKQRGETQRRKNERWADDYQMHWFFDRDTDILTMRNKFTEEFFCRFNMAYLNYEAGNWAVAKDMLEATRFLLATEDGPSAALLRYIKQLQYVAPKKWPGYRVLQE